MEPLARLHCRLCRQTFFTPDPNSPRCDLCGKTGGLIRAEQVEREQRARDTQREKDRVVREQAKKARAKLTDWQALGVACGLLAMVQYISWNLHPPRPWGAEWWFDMTSGPALLVGGSLFCLWRRKGHPPQT